jgi:DNA-binding transcriptional MocR family regulator
MDYTNRPVFIKMNSPAELTYLAACKFNGSKSKNDTIIEYIKNGISKGIIKNKLLSSRSLSELWKINRNTVTKAIEELIWEGVLISVPQKGIYVNKHIILFQKQHHRNIKKLSIPIKQIEFNHFNGSKVEVNNKTFHQLISKTINCSNTDATSTINEWLHSMLGLPYYYKHTFLNNIFEANYMLSRMLLSEKDEIIVSKNCQKKIIHHLPNLDIVLSSIPTKQNLIDLKKLEETFKNKERVKFIYLHYEEDGIPYTANTLINIMELCYRYGVMVIENISYHSPHFIKHLSCAHLDYRRFVLSVVHINFSPELSQTLLYGDEKIIEKLAHFKKNMFIKNNTIAQNIIAYLLQHPKKFALLLNNVQ